MKKYWIPPKILKSDLSDGAKLTLLVLIANNENGVCELSNEEIGQILNKDEKTIANILTELKKKKLVDTEYDGKIRIILPYKSIINNTDIDEKELNKQIAEIIDMFKKTINPAIDFSNVVQRNYAKKLILQFGFEETKKAIQFAISVQGEEYAPVISTPKQLYNKYGQLRIYYIRKVKGINKNKILKI